MGARETEFVEQFLPYVCLGDSIRVDIGEYTITARIAHDDTVDKPDERDCGFWPSLDPNAAGFIGAGNGWRKRFKEQQAKAESVMAASVHGKLAMQRMLKQIDSLETHTVGGLETVTPAYWRHLHNANVINRPAHPFTLGVSNA